ncbi:hypothetical protein DKX38_005241 [Salix brachista]|uniref:Uncharacterized protein n=1 Tax=Salix brachista TaxID=2182728 RepID=A0A5N5NDW6_9ROSI|nr:hypothetical protein DKX38_005241 [Salix brachista]
MGRKFWVMVGPEQEEHGRVVVRTVQAFEPWSYGSVSWCEPPTPRVKEDETPARFVGVQVPGAEAERSGLIDMLLSITVRSSLPFSFYALVPDYAMTSVNGSSSR